MERERQQQQLYALIKEMNEALDRKRWRRLPGLHQQVMRVFHDYAAWETDATALREVKDILHAAFEEHSVRKNSKRAWINISKTRKECWRTQWLI